MHALQQPHMDEARELFEHAIALDAKYAPAWAGLATLHALLYEWWGSKEEDLQSADRASRIALELAPELADAQLARGYTLSNMRRYEEACTHFDAAARIDPNYFRHLLTTMAARRSPPAKYQKSIELWHRGGTVRREDFPVPVFRGSVNAHTRPLRRARVVNRESVRRAERLLGSTRTTRAYCHWVQARCSWTARSSAHFEWASRAKELFPDDMGVVINSATIHARQGLKDAALDRLERIFGKGWGKEKGWINTIPTKTCARSRVSRR